VSKRCLLYKKTVTRKFNTLTENVDKIRHIVADVSHVITLARNDDDAAIQDSTIPPEAKIGKRFIMFKRHCLCSNGRI
jgi:hypothetical protein